MDSTLKVAEVECGSLSESQARDLWIAFEKIYPVVAHNEQPADFAEKMKKAYGVFFFDGSRHSSTAA